MKNKTYVASIFFGLITFYVFHSSLHFDLIQSGLLSGMVICCCSITGLVSKDIYEREATGKPEKESVLKKHSGKKLKVEASFYYEKKSGDNTVATLFSYPGSRGNNGSGGIELIFCYTSNKFEPGDVIDITYHEEDNKLCFVGKGIFKTSAL